MVVTHGGDLFAVCRARGWDWRDVLDFSASINPLGPPPGVYAALSEVLDRIVHYPEHEPARLAERLAAAWGVQPEQVLAGNGATELLHFLARVAPRVWPGQPVTLAVPVFSEFHRAYPLAALTPVDRPETWPAKGWLILTQPVNPTGKLVPERALCDLVFGSSRPVLVDESFLDFTDHPSAARWISQRPNLFVLRSLTKFYALPGLRIGALLAHQETLRPLRAWREPWQVNVLAEAAALTALADAAHATRSRSFVREERAWLCAQLAGLPGTAPQESEANYLLVRLAYPAGRLCAALRERRILIRNCAGWPGVDGDAVRVAVRTRAENERLVSAWRDTLCDWS
jgi:threonine-phosphate decarboxylase